MPNELYIEVGASKLRRLKGALIIRIGFWGPLYIFFGTPKTVFVIMQAPIVGCRSVGCRLGLRVQGYGFRA